MSIRKFLYGLIFSLCVPFIVDAADIKVTPMTSEESAYFLKEVNRIVYSADNDRNTVVSFYDATDELVAQEHSSKLKITFDKQGDTQGLDDVASGAAISFYPNPSKDVIFIKGMSETFVVEIYDMRGAKVMRQTSNGTVDVSQLSQGNYVLCVNKQYFKLTIQ